MEGYRLSPQQRDLIDIFGAQSIPVSGMGARFRGSPNAELLVTGLREIVRSEEVLRTQYPQVSGTIVQAIGSDEGVSIDLIDLSQRSVDDQKKIIDADLPMSGASEPHSASPAVHFTVYRLDSDEVYLAMRCSSLGFDATSFDRLIRRLMNFLEQGGTGQRSVADEEPLQYADISEWFISLLEDPENEQFRENWRQRLETNFQEPDLSPFSRHAIGDGFFPVSIPIQLTGGLSELLDRQSSKSGIDPGDILLSAWSLFLGKYNSLEPFSLFYESDGRSYDELADSLGVFAKAIPLDIDCAKHSSFQALCTATAKQRRMLQDKQEYLSWSHDLTTDSKLVGRNFLRAGFSALKFEKINASGPVTVTIDRISQFSLPFCLKLEVILLDAGPELHLWFDSGQIDQVDAQRAASRFQALLENCLSEFESDPRSLFVLDGDDINAIAKNVCDPLTAVGGGCLIEKFRDAVVRNGSRPAVSCGDRTLSYVELDEISTSLALSLVQSGVGVDSRVAICVDRDVDYMIAIIAVLKAGAAYVPLDPEYPWERVEFIIDDAEASMLLTSSHLEEKWISTSIPLVFVDTFDSKAHDFGALALPRTYSGDSLAYVLYTSGSTGMPKGVMVSRANLSYSTSARLASYGEEETCFLLLSPFAFDSSVAGIYWSIFTAGHLVIAQNKGGVDVDRVAAEIVNHEVTHTLMLPSLYGLLLDLVPSDSLQSLQKVVVAGESCSSSLVEKHLNKGITAALYNEYGPTECTVWATVHECGEIDSSQPVPIGCAIPGTAALVLDAGMQPAPVGVRGELFLYGQGVSAGYWKRDELTRERFIHIDTCFGSAVAYRTGDIARLREDGKIDFLGRRDFQVKVNGFRIELEEVENAILGIDGVDDAVVIAIAASRGGHRLAAYLRGADALRDDDLLTALASKLPDYMIPSRLHRVETFPRLANGKIDRGKLEKLGDDAPPRAITEPRDNLERLLVEIWENLLGREPIGVDDDFFKLGGHSILATRVIAQIRDLIQVQVPIRMLFDFPTISNFVEELRNEPSMSDSLAAFERELNDVANSEINPDESVA